ncbi:uncharacterized protein PGTG_22492 [Puccinia graminis f. sp. tritici CRL 75-36-700-3]|uniref:Uncharacterized protein n=1 Tax=Puccinia graminis f. sp. tritici (strain CRL 75-36-700-3 / race SCCL) TaxID=418459 RepID=H6QUM8_PUCGT|nr:uncharacterized protein PGTG_22492 [Puccinia graminis f. sp. tritici CRL 75-36-700-3]EHS64740.1 hypothetical protein PGTG_22492 [Puccinia graminis f. sp. tritici CRL 75-36-700-3]
MQRGLFLKIVKDIKQHDMYFAHKANTLGNLCLRGIQKITASLRILAYGGSHHATNKYICIGESTASKSLYKFYPIRYGIGQFIGSDRFFVTRYRKKGYWIAHPIRYPEYRIAAGSIAGLGIGIASRYRSDTDPSNDSGSGCGSSGETPTNRRAGRERRVAEAGVELLSK